VKIPDFDFSFFPPEKRRQRNIARTILEDNETLPKDKTLFFAKTYIERFLKPNADLKSIPLDRLSIDLFNKGLSSYENLYASRICTIDAPYHFFITYTDTVGKSYTIATIGFRLGKMDCPGCIFIEQIQGRGYEHFFLTKEALGIIKQVISSVRWEKMLIQVIEDWAKIYGFKKVAIKKSEYNHWRHSQDTPHNQRLKMLYDVTAKRMKYESKGKNKYRWKTLTTSTTT